MIRLALPARITDLLLTGQLFAYFRRMTRLGDAALPRASLRQNPTVRKSTVLTPAPEAVVVNVPSEYHAAARGRPGA